MFSQPSKGKYSEHNITHIHIHENSVGLSSAINPYPKGETIPLPECKFIHLNANISILIVYKYKYGFKAKLKVTRNALHSLSLCSQLMAMPSTSCISLDMSSWLPLSAGGRQEETTLINTHKALNIQLRNYYFCMCDGTIHH